MPKFLGGPDPSLHLLSPLPFVPLPPLKSRPLKYSQGV